MNALHPLSREYNKRLKKYFGKVQCPLRYNEDHELAIAVILSAQCTDERVNLVTPALFEKFKTLIDFANADQTEMEKLIFSTGFYKNKSKSIRGFAKKLLSEFGGVLPKTIPELISLPGIGRKTANVILSEIYGIADGVVVDTHVKRISRKLGLTKENDPVKIEKDLMKNIEKKYWDDFSLYLIFLGRKFCKARKTECENCPLGDICPSSNV
ncbi:MAG: endonuclease III [Leptospira sp.]|nr:endonuclease III [Leptospira sp.]